MTPERKYWFDTLVGGKFKVIEDESNGILVGQILDASEIFHC